MANSSRPSQHDEFLAKFDAAARQITAADLQEGYDASLALSPPRQTAHHSRNSSLPSALSSVPEEPPTRHHYPSRPVPVPTDDFAAPRSDSALAYAATNMAYTSSHLRGGSAGGSIETWRGRDKYEGGRVSGESRQRFTIGETYEYNTRRAGAGEKLGEKGAQGWEKEGGRKNRNKRVLWCLLVLALIAVAIGVPVGLTMKGDKSSTTTAADAASSSALPSSITPSSLSTPSAPTHTSTPLATPPASNPSTTPYVYVLSGVTTTVDVVYTLPTSYDTRTNGQWQFTQAVVLPSASGTGSFTSSLRFRVDPTAATTAGARRKRGYSERPLRVSLVRR